MSFWEAKKLAVAGAKVKLIGDPDENYADRAIFLNPNVVWDDQEVKGRWKLVEDK